MQCQTGTQEILQVNDFSSSASTYISHTKFAFIWAAGCFARHVILVPAILAFGSQETWQLGAPGALELFKQDVETLELSASMGRYSDSQKPII